MAEVSKIAANGIDYDIADETARSGLSTANSDISALQSGLQTTNGDISSLQGDMTSAQGDISTLQGNVSTLQSDLQTANGNITALQTQVNSLIAGGTGYCKMPDGTLIKWGIATGKTSGDALDYSANQAFYAAPTVIVSQAYNSTTTIRCNFGVASVTGSGCTVYAYDTSTSALSAQTNLAYHWLAIGRWK